MSALPLTMPSKARSSKSKTKAVSNLPLDDYLTIEEQIASSARGRAFLRMRDRRAALLGRDDWQAGLDDLRGWIEQSRGEAQEDAQLDVLRLELLEMAGSIRRAKSEIAALRPPAADGEESGASAGNRHLNLATEELGEIVHATERATSDILNGAERMMEIAGELRSPGIGQAAITEKTGLLEAIAMDTMTACSFQDITGQRISKVVNALRYIEERIDGMIRIWGPGVEGGTEAPPRPRDHRPDAHLLNGPALRGGMDQNSIDSLLAGMGSAPSTAVAEEDPWAEVGLPLPAPAVPAAAKPAPVEPEVNEADWGLPPATPTAPPAPKLVASNPTLPPAKAKADAVAAPVLDQSAIDNLFA